MFYCYLIFFLTINAINLGIIIKNNIETLNLKVAKIVINILIFYLVFWIFSSSVNYKRVWSEYYYGYASQYKREIQLRKEYINKQKTTDIVLLDPLRTKPATFFVIDVAEAPNSWQNYCYSGVFSENNHMMALNSNINLKNQLLWTVNEMNYDTAFNNSGFTYFYDSIRRNLVFIAKKDTASFVRSGFYIYVHPFKNSDLPFSIRKSGVESLNFEWHGNDGCSIEKNGILYYIVKMPLYPIQKIFFGQYYMENGAWHSLWDEQLFFKE